MKNEMRVNNIYILVNIKLIVDTKKLTEEKKAYVKVLGFNTDENDFTDIMKKPVIINDD